jgi:hypothetical protein
MFMRDDETEWPVQQEDFSELPGNLIGKSNLKENDWQNPGTRIRSLL